MKRVKTSIAEWRRATLCVETFQNVVFREEASQQMSSSTQRLAGKRAIVTGAAGPPGRAIPEPPPKEGADVAGLDLNTAGLDETAAIVTGHGVRSLSATADLTDFDAVQDAV